MLRERPAFAALRTLIRSLAGATCLGPLPEEVLPAGGRAYRFLLGEAGAPGTHEIVALSDALEGDRAATPGSTRLVEVLRSQPADVLFRAASTRLSTVDRAAPFLCGPKGPA